MRKCIKYLSVFSLWFAWLVLTAHLMIPHDHHLVESIAGQEESCPASHDSTNHHNGFPVHCHAFNDLTSEKAITYLIIRNVQSNDFVISSISDLTSHIFQVTGITIITSEDSSPASPLLEFSSLRAPPSIV